MSGVSSDAPNRDLAQNFPQAIVATAAKLDLLAPQLDARWGGQNWDPLSVGLLHEAAGRVCTAFRSLLTVQGIVAGAIERWGNHQQRAYWLPRIVSGAVAAICISEDSAGSDMAAIQASATVCDDDIVLNGHKRWVTFGAIASILLVIVNLDGKPTAVIVPANSNGVRVTPQPNLLGLRAAEVATIALQDVVVPTANILGRAGAGLFAVANSALDFGRYSIAWGAAGMAAGCLQDALAHTGSRVASGSVLRDHQLVRQHLSTMVVGLRTCQAHLMELAGRRENGAPSTAETSLAKYACSQLAMDATRRTVQLLGARGAEGGARPERFFRDAKILEIIEGTNEVHLLLLADHAHQVVRPL